jgi:hypothetical protein
LTGSTEDKGAGHVTETGYFDRRDGTDIGKNLLHLVGLDKRDPIVLPQKWSRGQVEARADLSPCLIG